ncbi:hypothetical protein F4820DRAFT_361917 [Hypoxylon rubiginosum]|uniref:Uncharacterized protein n=1 Tax=Hypoxylon rubiginosum TaxID=110542 RepID=A0ACB9YWM7_9PEZI|nr:hypothetical protein F4820DRAFT_361917 [Hypoxylon rubiginosum]
MSHGNNLFRKNSYLPTYSNVPRLLILNELAQLARLENYPSIRNKLEFWRESPYLWPTPQPYRNGPELQIKIEITMGNICGKSDSEAFSQPGRVLGAAPPQPQRAPVPATISSPPRTLGGGGGAPTPAQGAQNGANADEARRRAAEAAEARAKAATKSTGKLGTQLAAQKKQTRNDTLKEVSNSAIRQRDADEAAQARSHN